MGIINVTPDSFSGDGVLADGCAEASRGDRADPVERAVAQARRMVADGADILDIGGESTRPGPRARVGADEELRRVVPVIVGPPCAALPDVPISIDTTKAAVAEAALDAGADLINDVWGVGADDALPRLAAARKRARWWSCTTAPNRATTHFLPEIIDDLRAALDRARRAWASRGTT